jgi:hypothetical protein
MKMVSCRGQTFCLGMGGGDLKRLTMIKSRVLFEIIGYQGKIIKVMRNSHNHSEM